MNKLLTLFICILGFSFASESPSAEAKGCHPHNHGCCGCDTSRSRAQVRVLTNNFFELLATDSNVNNFETNFADSYTIREILPLCTDTDSCCVRNINSLGLYDEFNGSVMNYFINSLQYTKDGAIVVKGLATSSYASPIYSSEVFDYELTWVPAIGCNWKVSAVRIVSRACNPNTTLDCDNSSCNNDSD